MDGMKLEDSLTDASFTLTCVEGNTFEPIDPPWPTCVSSNTKNFC